MNGYLYNAELAKEEEDREESVMSDTPIVLA
jgi:hypothetical protein